MSNLQAEHHNVLKHFEEGLHVVRRSDRLWAGLSSDLMIEQALMRSLKTSGGGLTRGRGMMEQQRLQWLLFCLCRIQQGNVRADRGELQYWGAEQGHGEGKASP